MQRGGPGRLDIHWQSRAGWTPTANFRLQLAGGTGLVDTRLLPYRPDNEDGTFALLFAPALTTERAVSRDVILVLDTSGSMAGVKMQQAQAAATYVLDHLGAGDRFAVVSFAQTVRLYGNGLSPASERATGIEYVRQLVAAGGTNISGALERALALPTGERPATVIFLTDGLPTVGVTDRDGILALADKTARQRVQLFSFGLGSDVETVLLDALAQRFVGSSHYVAPEERVDSAVQQLFEHISTPMLTDVQISISGGDTYDLAPAELPGFFAGSQALLTGRYRTAGEATVTVRGNTPDGTRTFTYRITFPQRDGADPSIALIWAQRRIADLLTTLRVEGQQPQLVQQIVKIATRFGIVTPYTSYLAQEPKLALRPQDAASRVAQSAAAAPSTGASAVAGAADLGKLREGTAGAQAQQPVRTVGAHAYFLIDGTWVRDGFEPGTAAPEVRIGSREFADMLAADPELASAAALGERVVVRGSDGWRTLVWPASDGSATVTLPVLQSSGGTSSTPASQPPVVIKTGASSGTGSGAQTTDPTTPGTELQTSTRPGARTEAPAPTMTPEASNRSTRLIAAGIAVAAAATVGGAFAIRLHRYPLAR
jgi:Ca-activated chloride channel family protein